MLSIASGRTILVLHCIWSANIASLCTFLSFCRGRRRCHYHRHHWWKVSSYSVLLIAPYFIVGISYSSSCGNQTAQDKSLKRANIRLNKRTHAATISRCNAHRFCQTWLESPHVCRWGSRLNGQIATLRNAMMTRVAAVATTTTLRKWTQYS